MGTSRTCLGTRICCSLYCLAILLIFTGNTLADTHFVSPSGTHQAPFTNWTTAATNIQDAVDVTLDGDLVLVTNGAYATGGMAVHGTMTNRIAITNAITVRSVSNKNYTARAATNLITGFDLLLQDHFPATPPMNTYTDAPSDSVIRHYRVEVEPR